MQTYISGHESGDKKPFERSAGKIIIVGRFPEEGDDFKFAVEAEITTEKFFSKLGRPITGMVTPSKMSDYLVNAFDEQLAHNLGITQNPYGCRYAYVSDDGSRVIHQHST
jgi:hypothetical protein